MDSVDRILTKITHHERHLHGIRSKYMFGPVVAVAKSIPETAVISLGISGILTLLVPFDPDVYLLSIPASVGVITVYDVVRLVWHTRASNYNRTRLHLASIKN